MISLEILYCRLYMQEFLVQKIEQCEDCPKLVRERQIANLKETKEQIQEKLDGLKKGITEKGIRSDVIFKLINGEG